MCNIVFLNNFFSAVSRNGHFCSQMKNSHGLTTTVVNRVTSFVIKKPKQIQMKTNFGKTYLEHQPITVRQGSLT